MEKKKSKVMAFGTFDILHTGHLDFFKQAGEHGSHLIVVVAQDRNVQSIKGRLPVNPLDKRIKAIKDKGVADEVIAGNKKDLFCIIREKKPDVICLGYDQNSLGLEFDSYIKESGTDIKRLKAYNPSEYKSSIIKKNKKYMQSCPELI